MEVKFSNKLNAIKETLKQILDKINPKNNNKE